MQLNMSEVVRELLPIGPAPQPDEIELKELFLKLWPEEVHHLATYRAKPDCSCRGYIQQAMVKDTAKLQQFLMAVERLRGKQFLRPPPEETLMAEEPTPKPPPSAAPIAARPAALPPLRHLAGQTRDIPDTPEAYANLLRDLHKQGLRFMGLTLRPVGEHQLRVYFY